MADNRGVVLTEFPQEGIFMKALESLFVGAKVEGDSGFVNLMRVKHNYFRSISPRLMEGIAKRAPKGSEFREELFRKLYSFFKSYFCESGSIYFRYLPAFAKTYERVYEEGRDVALAWKTHMLYYVKSDVLLHSMPVELESGPGAGDRFYFDVSGANGKKNNEKKEFVFSFLEVKRDESGAVVHLGVSYSQNGTKSKLEDIVRAAKKERKAISAAGLQEAIAVFRRQTEVDFFINKDARKFLREQFDLWMHQYLFSGETLFEQERLSQLQAIRDTAHEIIDFIAQFEDELVRVWNKPKFVRASNYVITLDRIRSDALARKIKGHANYARQAEEWQGLGIDADNPKAPIDTGYFKDLELEILQQFDNLDEALDGWLIKSENYQALNTLLPKFRGKAQAIYIDPPFNLDSSDQFRYRTNYKDANWATLLENRLVLARGWLQERGSIFVRCDYNGNWIVRCIMDEIFGRDNLRNEIAVKRTRTLKGESGRFHTAWESLYFYGNSKRITFNGFRKLKPEEEWEWVDMHLPGSRKDESMLHRDFFGKRIKAPDGRRWTLSQEGVDDAVAKGLVRMDAKTGLPKFLTKWETLGSNWTDISGYSPTWDFTTENSEVLLHRAVESVSGAGDMIVDFFLGSGTTIATAHKMGRKWLGVEMEDHCGNVILPRMKKVLAYDQSGISKELEDYSGGGFFKYCALEQYEEALLNARYDDGEQLELNSAKSPFAQYVFFADDKFAYVLEQLRSGELKINLGDLYGDIDIAESLANATGKAIKQITEDTVVFADGSAVKTNPGKMTADEQRHFAALIKPYLWWGEEK